MNVKSRDCLYSVVRHMHGNKAHIISVHPSPEVAEQYAIKYTQDWTHQTKLSPNEFSFEVQPVYFYEQ